MIALLLVCALSPADATAVGMPGKLTVTLPGSELIAEEITDRQTPVVVRVLAAEKEGDGYRYDLEYVGLVPGEHDVTRYLRRKDRSPVGTLPAATVRVTSLLAPNVIKPADLGHSRLPWLGGYRLVLILLTILWLIGLAAIFLIRRKRPVMFDGGPSGPTLADRLRPVVERAMVCKCDTGELAELERLLILYWIHRRGMHPESPADVLPALRRDAEAGPLLGQLERWLHMPEPAQPADVEALLRPYRDVGADVLDAEGFRV